MSTQEDAMRPPEVFVRELTPEEGVELKRISKRAKYQSKRQRAMIVLASSTGSRADDRREQQAGDDQQHNTVR
jgi:hypothetical protein